MQAICAGCKQLIDMPDLQNPNVVNMPGVSILIVEHSKVGWCPNCKLGVAHYISNMPTIPIGAMPLAPDPRIIRPSGPDLRLVTH
jgi:hypothetical protein